MASSEPQSCKENSGAVQKVDAADEAQGKLTAKEAIRSQGPLSAVDVL